MNERKLKGGIVTLLWVLGAVGMDTPFLVLIEETLYREILTTLFIPNVLLPRCVSQICLHPWKKTIRNSTENSSAIFIRGGES